MERKGAQPGQAGIATQKVVAPSSLLPCLSVAAISKISHLFRKPPSGLLLAPGEIRRVQLSLAIDVLYFGPGRMNIRDEGAGCSLHEATQHLLVALHATHQH